MSQNSQSIKSQNIMTMIVDIFLFFLYIHFYFLTVRMLMETIAVVQKKGLVMRKNIKL